MAKIRDIIEEHISSGKTEYPKKLVVKGVKWDKKSALSLSPDLDLPKDVYFEVSEEEFKDLEEIGVEDTVNSWLYDTYSVKFIEYKAIRFIY